MSIRLRPLLRLLLIAFGAIFIAFCLVATVYVFCEGPQSALDQAEDGWFQAKDRLDRFRNSSRTARWWRCLGEDVPDLAELASSEAPDLEVRFSWTGGFGEGDLHVTVKGTGEATARIERHGADEPEIHRTLISRDDLLHLLSAIQSTGFLCLRSEKRIGYRVIDLGRFEVAVQAPGFSRVVFVDGTHTVPDGDAFEEVLYSLDRQFGVNLCLGPFGTSTVRAD